MPINDIKILTNVDDSSIPDVMSVVVELPNILKKKILVDERTVNILHVATIIYNEALEKKPEIGISKVIVLLNSEKIEYDFRIHNIFFSPSIDLDNVTVISDLTSTDNKMLNRLIADGVLSFNLTGKMILDSSKDIESIVISRIKPHVDQTAYAKKFAALKKKSGENVSEATLKQSVFNNPQVDVLIEDEVLKKSSSIWAKYFSKNKDKIATVVKKSEDPIYTDMVSRFKKIAGIS